MDARIVKLNAGVRSDFYKVHHSSHSADWCYCVAWWIPAWEGWGGRTSAENRQVRDELFDSGMYDGFLLYINNEPAGWCQCAPRDQFVKLCKNYRLNPDPEIWAITCFFLIPLHRKQKLANTFLTLVLNEIAESGVRHVQAFPRCGESLTDNEIWTGPESLFLKSGFVIEQPHPTFPVYGKTI